MVIESSASLLWKLADINRELSHFVSHMFMSQGWRVWWFSLTPESPDELKPPRVVQPWLLLPKSTAAQSKPWELTLSCKGGEIFPSFSQSKAPHSIAPCLGKYSFPRGGGRTSQTKLWSLWNALIGSRPCMQCSQSEICCLFCLQLEALSPGCGTERFSWGFWSSGTSGHGTGAEWPQCLPCHLESQRLTQAFRAFHSEPLVSLLPASVYSSTLYQNTDYFPCVFM